MADFYYEWGNGQKSHVKIDSTAEGYQVTIGERQYRVRGQMNDNQRLDFVINGNRQQAYIATKNQPQPHLQKEIELWFKGQTWTLQSTDNRRQRSHIGAIQSSGTVTAAMPSQVQSILVEEGQVVTSGEPLLILEAMKMETRIAAPHDGQVYKISCAVGDVVERGQVLVEIK